MLTISFQIVINELFSSAKKAVPFDQAIVVLVGEESVLWVAGHKDNLMVENWLMRVIVR